MLSSDFGEIENLPLADHSVDVVISNCVINLSTDKTRVFQEIYRVLETRRKNINLGYCPFEKASQKIQENMLAYVGCIAGAIFVDEYKKIVEASGFERM